MVKIKIKKLLNKKDKSLYWLSNNANLTYTALHRIANHKTEGIKFHTLEEIMKALNITDFNEIMEIVPEKEK